MAKIHHIAIPEYHSITEFLRGQASRIFSDVKEKDKVVIVNKQNKPQAVIISSYSGGTAVLTLQKSNNSWLIQSFQAK